MKTWSSSFFYSMESSTVSGSSSTSAEIKKEENKETPKETTPNGLAEIPPVQEVSPSTTPESKTPTSEQVSTNLDHLFQDLQQRRGEPIKSTDIDAYEKVATGAIEALASIENKLKSYQESSDSQHKQDQENSRLKRQVQDLQLELTQAAKSIDQMVKKIPPEHMFEQAQNLLARAINMTASADMKSTSPESIQIAVAASLFADVTGNLIKKYENQRNTPPRSLKRQISHTYQIEPRVSNTISQAASSDLGSSNPSRSLKRVHFDTPQSPSKRLKPIESMYKDVGM